MGKPFLVDELFSSWAPGVYRTEEFAPRQIEFATGVPVFIGSVTHTREEAIKKPQRLHFWPQFKLQVIQAGMELPDSMLAYAVRGFFQNGGRQCYVIPLSTTNKTSLNEALETASSLDVDL